MIEHSYFYILLDARLPLKLAEKVKAIWRSMSFTVKVISKSSFWVFEYSHVLCVMRVLRLWKIFLTFQCLCVKISLVLSFKKGENILNINVLISPQGKKRHRTNISYDAAHWHEIAHPLATKKKTGLGDYWKNICLICSYLERFNRIVGNFQDQSFSVLALWNYSISSC